jgi:phosphatidyl-myo-inositol alpha-mannosyltransferase
MKVGIVVPFSWSFPGGVVEHAEHQARALRALGVDTRTIIGNDPPGTFTRFLHPRSGRHGEPPPGVIPVGRSVIVPANGSLPNVVLSPSAPLRVWRVLEQERFDVLHLHEPMTPAICTSVLIRTRWPTVATWHAAGRLSWMRAARHFWGFLAERVDHRIAVSEQARDSILPLLPGEYELIPNGVAIPPAVDAGERENRIVFIGRHDPRKGMPVLLQAWPEIRRQTGARLRIVGADPLAVRLLLTRLRVSEEGIDVLGWVTEARRTDELLSAKALVAPSTGRESFGLVLAEAFACATPVVSSDIPGYRAVMTGRTGLLAPPGDPPALADAVTSLLADEGRRQAFGAAARAEAEERYSWADIARRLLDIYDQVTRRAPAGMAAVG